MIMIKILLLFFSIFSLIYGIIMLFTNITKTFFLIWVVVSIFTYIIYKFFQNDLVYKIPNIIRKIFLVSTILVIIVYISNMIEISKDFNKKPQENLDYIIVPGALVTDNGPALSTIYRLDEAIKYLNENPNTKCILTGGKGYNEPECESIVMAEYLIEHNIDESRLIIEKESTSTYENLEYSKNFIDISNNSVGIVTNNFHVHRAIYLANKLGYKNVSGISSYSLPINTLSNVCREAVGMMIYKLKYCYHKN